MRRMFAGTLFVLTVSLVAMAQGGSAPLPAGVRFPAQLLTKLNAHKATVGEEVKLEVTNNLRGPGGVVVLPQGAKLIGTVTAVKPHSGDEESELSFLVTRAEWKGGSMDLHAAPAGVTALKMRTEREGGGPGGAGGGEAGGFDSGGRGGRSGGSGGRGGGDDTNAMLAAAMAREIKGVEARDSGDPKIGKAFFLRGRDVSLPSGVIITLVQTEAAPQ